MLLLIVIFLSLATLFCCSSTARPRVAPSDEVEHKHNKDKNNKARNNEDKEDRGRETFMIVVLTSLLAPGSLVYMTNWGAPSCFISISARLTHFTMLTMTLISINMEMVFINIS